MKTIIAVLVILAAAAQGVHSQNVNWRSIAVDQPNHFQLNVGYDYGVTTQVGYSRSFFFLRPVLLGLDYSMPMGNILLDDFKVRLGGQIEVFETHGFSATIKILANFRRYENGMVRIVSFGADYAAVVGYYDPDWYAAGEFGFDKAVTTHLKHSDAMRTYGFPGIKDGWYVPTGGHFYYGIQGGKSLWGHTELSLRAGMTDAQFDDEEAMLPYYFQLGFGVNF